MSVDPSAVNVLVPDQFGVTVCDLAGLLMQLDEADSIDDLTMNAGFDSCQSIRPGGDEIVRLVDRVRALNLTNDVDQYWAET